MRSPGEAKGRSEILFWVVRCAALAWRERLEVVWPPKGRICDQNSPLIDYLSAFYCAMILQNCATNSFWAYPQEFALNICFHNGMRSAVFFTCTRSMKEVKWKDQELFLKIWKGLGFLLSKIWKMWRLSKLPIFIFHFKWKPSQSKLMSPSLEQND